jgi:hypothetical protein
LTRKNRVVKDPIDQTPIETDEPAFVPPKPERKARPARRHVEITPAGADAQCWSEHGMHETAGVIIETTYADIFVERGWAKEVD